MSGSGERAQWGSKLGFVLAAAGSAVGLGNIWRFPYLTQENGGGIFVLFYLLAAVVVGLPVMLGELAIGRHAQRNAVGAYAAIAPSWKWLGFLGVVTGVAILSYYSVVAGWTVGYIVKSASGDLDPAAFGTFVADPVLQIVYLAVFVVLTAVVVRGGVRQGIERMSLVLMPALLVLLLALIVRGLTLPTAAAGLEFYLTPDFDRFSAKTVLDALGQQFFSMSLGMGAMITYGSYLRKSDNLVTSAASVALFDTAIAVLAGLMVFPVIGHSLDKGGPSLVFVAMIEQFSTMTGGTLVAVAFFVLLAIAALTSTVSLLEVATAYLVDERGWSRPRSVVIVSLATLLLGLPSALSLGAVPALGNVFHGMAFLDLMDFLFGSVSLTLGALAMSFFLVWRWGVGNAAEEVKQGFPAFARFVPVWRVLLAVVVPVAILAILGYKVYTDLFATG